MILVTGATGQTGRHLVAELVARGTAVGVLSRDRSAVPVPGWQRRRWSGAGDVSVA